MKPTRNSECGQRKIPIKNNNRKNVKQANERLDFANFTKKEDFETQPEYFGIFNQAIQSNPI
jgi:ribosomal protein L19E